MGLEVATYINGLVTTNPIGVTDPKSQGDDHLRLIKTVLKNTFPNLTGAMTMTQAQLNAAAQTNVANIFTALQTIDLGTTGHFTGRCLDLKSFAPGLFFWDETTSAIKSLIDVDGNILTIYSTPNTDGTSLTTRMTINLSTGEVTVPGDLDIGGTITSSGTTFGFESGTTMLFRQTAAPTGWTKELTHNNKALRCVTGTVGSGGSVAFTTAFASKAVSGSIGSTTATGTVENHTLTASQMPAHTHSFSGSDSATTSSNGSHSHNMSFSVAGSGGAPQIVDTNGSPTATTEATSSAGAHTHTVSVTISGTTGSAGSGSAHNHGFTGNAHNHTFTGTPIDLTVQYVDVIIASKD